MVQTDSHLASPEIHRLLWNRKVHYRVQKGSPLDPTLSQENLVRTLTFYFRIHFNIIFLYMPVSPKWSFPLRFPN